MLMQNLVLCLCNGGTVCSLQTRKWILKYHFHKRHVFSDLFPSVFSKSWKRSKTTVTAAYFSCSGPTLLHVRRSVHHSIIHKEKCNKMQHRIKIVLFHIYMKLNMFRATHSPSSGA
jgi:hypothetical protein